MTRNNGRNTDGKFSKGNPGRPPGSRNRATRAAEALLDREAEALGRKAIEMALRGDSTALRLCLERLVPPRKDSPVQFDMPNIANAKDAGEAAKAVLSAVATGDLTPAEAGSVMAIIERYSRVTEVAEFEARLDVLEQAIARSEERNPATVWPTHTV